MKNYISLFISIMLVTIAFPNIAEVVSGEDILLGSKEFRIALRINVFPLYGNERSRFDRTAMVRQIFDNDKAMLTSYGLSDEFGINGKYGVFGYESATAADPGFLKVGVGVLKCTSTPYSFEQEYKLLKSFPVELLNLNKHECIVKQQGEFQRWRYTLCKRYIVIPQKKILRIEYSFTNKGQEPLEIEHYNHNYLKSLNINGNAHIRMRSNFPLSEYSRHWINAGGFNIALLKAISDRLYYSSSLSGRQENHQLAIYIDKELCWTISGNCPTSRFALYVSPRILAPEIFCMTKIMPRTTQQWIREYQIGNYKSKELTNAVL